MEAGRELDALIAKKVFGCPVVYKDDRPWCGCKDEEHATWWHEIKHDLKWYSTDLEEAWEVVEKIKRDHAKDPYGDDFFLRQDGAKWVAGFGTDAPHENFGSDPDSEGTADTVPHAICLAALKAHASFKGS